MGKLTIIGDPHITHKSLDRGAHLFYETEQRGLTCIWLGDFLDTKEVIRGKCLNFLYDQLSASSLNHIVLVGNHDWFNLECQDHSLRTLQDLKNVEIIDKPTRMGNMLFVPYMHDLEKLRAVLNEYRNQDLVLVGHLEISNFDFGNGHVCTKGLTLEDVAGFKRVISGHFHKYQTEGNLTYLGTPFSHSFGETDQTKYLGTYDTETDELTIDETPFPKHITKEFNCDLLNERCEHWLFDPTPGYEKNFYRVILTGTQANIDRFPRFMYDEGGTNGKLNIKWITRPSDHAENSIEIDETVSNEAQFTKWATTVRKLDDETVKLGLQILEACR